MAEPVTPIRIQRKRTKGWRMPANTISVCRPGKWGNPFYAINEDGYPWITDKRDESMPALNADAEALLGIPRSTLWWPKVNQALVALFEQQCMDRSFEELRGKNLACFCRLCDAHRRDGKPFTVACSDCLPCHSDSLGRRANGLRCEGT